ncbi:MAG: aminomethyl-transferring glycine dehydrogenase [Myxococcales bacterium]|nr:aminomethyl-transferring glycine dehydrogenase [Myxococcales bacterium]
MPWPVQSGYCPQVSASSCFPATDTFVRRHLGPREGEIRAMLETLSVASLDALADETIPPAIRTREELEIGDERSETELLAELAEIASKNDVYRSYIGMGYHGCTTPPVILRNILENPGWYTQYTPYQAEIAQGRLEALINFQTAVAELTGLPLANSSLLDEATAAAEAMMVCYAAGRRKRSKFYAADDCHPQTLALLKTRSVPIGVELVVCPPSEMQLGDDQVIGVLLQYPGTDGRIVDYTELCAEAHAGGAMVVMACDLLALTLLTPPGELGADVAIGTTQRFGVPMGYGGPHAAYISTSEKYKRQMPGRIIGVSKDARGRVAYRLALQTREQHIRRDKALSNICTAQVLLAIMAGMYAVYHGPGGLVAIAKRCRGMTLALRKGLLQFGLDVDSGPVFDTLRIRVAGARREGIVAAGLARKINLRHYDDGLGLALDETCADSDVEDLLEIFAGDAEVPTLHTLCDTGAEDLPGALMRKSACLSQPVFTSYHAEHEMLRYLHRLQAKDLSLTTSMIALGSCTMKLNATSEMLPISWPEFANLHPAAPASQTQGYAQMTSQLEEWLANITGMHAVSLQPNSGAQGEYAGLLVIRAYQQERGEAHRDVCLIPVSAHGTNPASAVLAGFKVVTVKCDDLGNIDIEDLRKRAEEHKDNLAATMITYPSTHGVFENGIVEICEVVHSLGGQVYLDGANMNAQVGLCRPGDYGADVIHLNLHKTFSIPHGGGGPGMGPIAVAKQLASFLPGHPMNEENGPKAIGPISAAPMGSPSVLPISWMYIGMMGSAGLRKATQVAILNANYMARRLGQYYDLLYSGRNGFVAHEFILDMRPFKRSAGIEVDDIAKRLMDYGFHAPTMSFPVPGTLMIEPTESESKVELDRFCDAMISIREEIRSIEEERIDRDRNPLKLAPHSALDITDSDWDRPYDRDVGAFPAEHLRDSKYWPPVSRIDNAFGDRNLVCTCPSIEELAE